MSWQITYCRPPHDFSALPFKMKELTQLIKITPQISGQGIRFVLQNQFGTTPLTFDHIEISSSLAGADVRTITRGGKEKITIPTRSIIKTDALPISITKGQPFYLIMRAVKPQKYADFSCIYDERFYSAVLANSATCQPSLPHNWQARKGWFCLNRVEVWTELKPQLLELTGDSLAETGMIETGLLQGLPTDWVMANTGVSGNRLLHDAPRDGALYKTFGQALQTRVNHDEFDFPHQVVALIGSNDLVLPLIDKESRHELIEPTEYMQGIARLRMALTKRGCSLLLTTIPPFDPIVEPADQGLLKNAQDKRRLINDYLRLQPNVLDLDPLLLADSGVGMKTQYDFGDHLHFNDAGGKIVAQAILQALHV